jgi:uncharacterized protein (DUF885 family)
MTDPAAAFAAAAATVLADAFAANPVRASLLGAHEYDDRLPDPSAAAADDRLRDVRSALAALDSIPTEDIGLPDAIDAEILRTALAAELVSLTELREGDWNPMAHNPGRGIHVLLARDYAPLPQRLAAVASRLGATPSYLAAARKRMSGEIPRAHAETAVGQLRGALTLLGTAVPAAAREARAEHGSDGAAAASAVEAPLAAAREALREHLDWLDAIAGAAHGQARLGAERFAAKLWLNLDTALDPETLLARASTDLERVTEQITAEAARLAGSARPDADTVRAVLDQLGDDAPTDATVLGHAAGALAEAIAFTREQDLVGVPEDIDALLEVIEMPEIDRGVAVAHCRPPGPLETGRLPTFFAVSPAPATWDAQRVASFYREYNTHMLADLAVHEGVPGHALQMAHARRYRGNTDVRRAYWSGTFTEGWAVYAEELAADHGFRSAISPEAAGALRMQQLKMQLRMILNAVLDIRHHTGDLTEAEAMRLMTERGFQEEGEAAGKWRRVQLTSTQLCTYYVGYLEWRDVMEQLSRERPGASLRRLHDEALSFGSPSPRHLREELGLGSGL